jgi:hypothetical protein
MSATRFTKEEEDSIRQALKSGGKLRSARELHGFVQRYNWDDGLDVLFAMIRHPLCDRGTALMIYWLADPSYAKSHATREDVPEYNRSGYDLVMEIETRMLAGGFRQAAIGYAPVDEDLVPEAAAARARTSSPIPEMMWQRSPGPCLIPPFTQDKILRSLNDREMSELERQFALAFTVLKEAGQPAAPQDEPAKIVGAISAAAVVIREDLAGKKKKWRTQHTTALQWLWKKQLCRCGAWRWAASEPAQGGNPMVITTDGKWYGIFKELQEVIYWSTSANTWRRLYDQNPANAGLSWDGQITRRFAALCNGSVGRRHGVTPMTDIFPLDETWIFAASGSLCPGQPGM